MMMKKLLFALVLAPLFASAQPSYTEAEKIDHLIMAVRSLKDAVFIRNGSEHTATEAADHLAMKRKRAGKRLKTVDDFIVGVASKSSLSGKPYMVRFKNGREYSAEMLLRLEL